MTNCENMRRRDSDEDTKVASNSNSNRRKEKYSELLQEYQHAVDCIMSCESIINTLQEQLESKDEELESKDEQLEALEELKEVQLESKDELIAALEEKLVKMSLELASSKAFEDEYRNHRRISNVDIAEDEDGDGIISDDEPASLEPQDNNKTKQRVAPQRAKSMDLAHEPGNPPSRQRQPRRRWSLAPPPRRDQPRKERRSDVIITPHPNSMVVDDEPVPKLDDSATSRSTINTLDESNSSRRLSIAQFFGGNKNRGNNNHNKNNNLRDSNTSEETEEKMEEVQVMTQPLRGGDGGGRRPPNRARMQRMQSSRSFLEAVVFPRNFDDVLDKGCAELRQSLKVSADSLQTVNWD